MDRGAVKLLRLVLGAPGEATGPRGGSLRSASRKKELKGALETFTDEQWEPPEILSVKATDTLDSELLSWNIIVLQWVSLFVTELVGHNHSRFVTSDQ